MATRICIRRSATHTGPGASGSREGTPGSLGSRSRGLSVDPVAASRIVLRVARRPVITYRGRHQFPISPAELWDIIQEVDQFEGWWSWLEEFSLDGDSLQAGAVLTGVVVPPLPYRMRIAVAVTRCEPQHSIEALIHGDLEGEAALELCERGVGTEVGVSWTVEMMQAPMRLADRLAHPVLQWGHDRVVDLTVSGFRNRLTSEV